MKPRRPRVEHARPTPTPGRRQIHVVAGHHARRPAPGPRPGGQHAKEHSVDHPLLDTGQVAPAVRELYPDGVDAALDLVGTPTLPDTLRAVRVHGTACFSGSLSNQWTVRDFAPNEYLPRGGS